MSRRASWWRRLIRQLGGGLHMSASGHDPDDTVTSAEIDRDETRREQWEGRPTEPEG